MCKIDTYMFAHQEPNPKEEEVEEEEEEEEEMLQKQNTEEKFFCKHASAVSK